MFSSVSELLYSRQNGQNKVSVRGPVIAAALGHLLFLTFFVLTPSFHGNPPRSRPLVNVQMVSLRTNPGGLPGPAQQDRKAPQTQKPPSVREAIAPVRETPPTPIKKEVPPVPVPAQPVPEKTIAPKTSLKKKTFQSTQAIEKAIKQLEATMPSEKSEPSASQESLSDRLEQMRKAVGERESASSQSTAPAAGTGTEKATSTTSGGGGSGGGGGRGAGGATVLDLYQNQVARQIEKNWAFNKQMVSGDHSLMVAIVFKVLPSGEIVDITFSDRSPSTYLNDSAYRAIVKSSPVMPYPPGLNQPYVTMGIRFTPQGIR